MTSNFLAAVFENATNTASETSRSYGEGFEPPTDDYVLCRDHHGQPTAIYGHDQWDLNPYRLRAKRVSLFRFDLILDGDGPEERDLINQVKYLMFCLLKFIGTGMIGHLSPGSLTGYMVVLRSLARFCMSQKSNRAAGVLSFEQLFTTPVYLAAFLKNNPDLGSTQRSLLRALIGHLVTLGEERLGYRVQGVFDLKYGDTSSTNQHPVIPTRIYLELINVMADRVEQMCKGRDRLEDFLASFAIEGYGTTRTHQLNVLRIPESRIFPNMAEAIELRGLGAVFSGEFSCKHRGVLSSAILKIQWVIKHVIHAYTGMRDQEVIRLPYNCLSLEEVIPETVDDHGVVRDKARMVDLISTTTKFTGYRKSESWLAPKEVIRAVEVAQAICRGLAAIYGVKPETTPLFLNPAIISRSATKFGVSLWNDESKAPSLMSTVVIDAAALQELTASDPTRDFASEAKFQIGQPWPLTSHQFRRSLAFYGSSSGFVSMPSLKKQFKHMTMQMARYYGNNFEKLKTIFGFYDAKKKQFVIPKNHMAFEFQMGMPMSMAYDLLAELLGSENPLFGGVGGYAEKQRQRLVDGDVSIAEIRVDTVKQVASGRLSYRPTLLGGCTKTGPCDEYMLGDFSACLSCEGSIIKQENVVSAISDAKEELEGYELGTGEYQVTQSELARLVKYNDRLIAAAQIV